MVEQSVNFVPIFKVLIMKQIFLLKTNIHLWWVLIDIEQKETLIYNTCFAVWHKHQQDLFEAVSGKSLRTNKKPANNR